MHCFYLALRRKSNTKLFNKKKYIHRGRRKKIFLFKLKIKKYNFADNFKCKIISHIIQNSRKHFPECFIRFIQPNETHIK